MAIEVEFAEMMAEPVVVKPWVGTDSYGKRTYGAGVTLLGRNMGGTPVRNIESGRTSYPDGRVILYGTPTVSVHDQLTLDDGTLAVITKVDYTNDQNGPHHVTVTYSAGG